MSSVLVLYSTVFCNFWVFWVYRFTVLYTNTLLYCTVLYSTVLCTTVLYCTVKLQYSTVQYK